MGGRGRARRTARCLDIPVRLAGREAGRPGGSARLRRGWVVQCAMAALAAAMMLAPTGAAADPGDIGVTDFSWAGTRHPTGTKRPASEL